MAGTFKFELVSPERMVMSADADQVILAAAAGQMTVLPGHAPVVAALQPGLVEITAGGKVHRVFVGGGFAEIDPERLTVLAEKAIDAGDLKGNVLESELRAAEAALTAATTDDARWVATTALDALRGLQVAR
jgi:F-type H+-transporting ATPase subunit epsilon